MTHWDLLSHHTLPAMVYLQQEIKKTREGHGHLTFEHSCGVVSSCVCVCILGTGYQKRREKVDRNSRPRSKPPSLPPQLCFYCRFSSFTSICINPLPFVICISFLFFFPGCRRRHMIAANTLQEMHSVTNDMTTTLLSLSIVQHKLLETPGIHQSRFHPLDTTRLSGSLQLWHQRQPGPAWH